MGELSNDYHMKTTLKSEKIKDAPKMERLLKKLLNQLIMQ
jgi:hypothetical protein